MKILWTAAAKQDRQDIVDYIEADDPRAAAGIDRLFENASTRLGRFPEMGRPGRVPGTRELIPHKSYRMVYEVDADTIWIHALIHTSREWPPKSGGHS